MKTHKKKFVNSLSERSVTALKWNYIGAFAAMLSQFAIGIVLARLLGPEPFGVVAIALLVLSLGNLFAEGGLGAALIQKRDITDQDIRSVFFAQILIGFFIAAAVIAFTPWIVSFFKKPDAKFVVMVMAISMAIQPVGQTATALLRRKLEFKKIQLIRLISYLFGYLAIGVPLAFLGVGVWSLVVAHLIQTTFYSFTVYFIARHPVFPLARPDRCRLLKFGATLTANNITSWGISNLDTAIVGRFFGTVDLGLYNRAFNLVNMPMSAVVSSIQGVLFSAYARSQDNRSALRRTYVVSIGGMALLLLPMFAAVSAVPESIILGLYGGKWQLAIPLLTPLALAMPLNAMLAMAGPLLTGIGLPQKELIAQIVTLFFMVPALLLASRHSLEAVAWVILCTYILRFLLLTLMSLHAIDEKIQNLINILFFPTVIAVILSAFSFSIDRLLISIEFGPSFRLILVILSCALSYLVLLFLFRKQIVRGPTKSFLITIQDKLPSIIVRWANIRT